jgi:Mn-containing catalase
MIPLPSTAANANRVDAPNPAFAKMCLEQFGGKDGELAAACAILARAGQKVMSRGAICS